MDCENIPLTESECSHSHVALGYGSKGSVTVYMSTAITVQKLQYGLKYSENKQKNLLVLDRKFFAASQGWRNGGLLC